MTSSHIKPRIAVLVVALSVVVLGSCCANAGSHELDPTCPREESTWGEIKAWYGDLRRVEVAASTTAATPEPSPVTYPLRDTPEHAVEKLRQAYVAKDLAAFTDCLSDTFRFWIDESAQPSIPDFWGFSTEYDIHAVMFGDTLTDWITLSFVLAQAPEEVPGATPSWLLRMNHDLWIKTWLWGDWAYLWGAGGSLFKVSVDPDERGPCCEVLWEVADWAEGDHFETPVAQTSWGKIKSLYR